MSELVPLHSGRIRSLQLQNANFKRLVDVAKEYTMQNSDSITQLQDESKFIQQAIMFIDYEKELIQKENNIFSDEIFSIEEIENNDEIAKRIKVMDAENIDLRKRLMDVLEQSKEQTIELQQIEKEQNELYRLLFDQKTNLFGILQIPYEKIESPKFLPLPEAKTILKEYIFNHVKSRASSVKSFNTEDECDFKSFTSDTDYQEQFFGDGDKIDKQKSIFEQIQNFIGPASSNLNNEYWRAHKTILEGTARVISTMGYLQSKK